MEDLLANTLTIPVSWILASVGGLCGTVATLAATVYKIMKNRLDAQDKILSLQDSQIDALKAEVIRLAQGCGVEACHWKMFARGIKPNIIS